MHILKNICDNSQNIPNKFIFFIIEKGKIIEEYFDNFIIFFIFITWEYFIPNPYDGNKILSKYENVIFL